MTKFKIVHLKKLTIYGDLIFKNKKNLLLFIQQKQSKITKQISLTRSCNPLLFNGFIFRRFQASVCVVCSESSDEDARHIFHTAVSVNRDVSVPKDFPSF